jgi:UDP-glucose:(heptosyl)LPS alpha-1,3-glucosyltransferase
VQKLSLERSEGPVIAVSESLRDQLETFYDIDPERLRVVYNGVELDRFHPDRDGSQVRTERDFDEDDEVLLFVGHEYERKGFADILEALPNLPDRVQLLSVGGGDRQPWIERARELGVRERVTFTGYVPDEDLPGHYAAADAFVFPTRYEAHSLVVLEALASGLPVVLGDVPATREVVTDGREGHLVPTGEPGELAEGIRQAVGNPEMAERARERGEEFPWDRTAEETRAVYEQALAER